MTQLDTGRSRNGISRRSSLKLVAGAAAASIVGLGNMSTGRAGSPSATPLRDLAASRGLAIGTDYYENYRLPHLDLLDTFLGREYNLILLDYAWWRGIQVQQYGFRNLRPSAKEWDFTFLDASVEYAVAHDMRIRGGLLGGAPPWLTEAHLSPTDARSQLVDSVNTIVGRYKGVVSEWIAINEYFWYPPGQPSGNIWFDALGESYVDLTCETARRADPDARLILSNFMNLQPGFGADFDATQVRRLKAEGLVDMYGFQTHLAGESPPDPAAFTQVLRQFQALGVEVVITEMDVNLRNLDGALPAKLATEAKIYDEVLRAYFGVGGRSVSFFGPTDFFSWLGANAYGTMWDADSQPKPAFFAAEAAIEAVPEVSGYRRFAPGLASD